MSYGMRSRIGIDRQDSGGTAMTQSMHWVSVLDESIGQDKPVWEGCGRGLAQGAHGYALIGRNEKGVQLMHESVARLTGYKGLSYL